MTRTQRWTLTADGGGRHRGLLIRGPRRDEANVVGEVGLAGGVRSAGMAIAGDLDATFGSGGKKTVNFGGTDAARAVLVQPNGRVVVAGGGGPADFLCVVRPALGQRRASSPPSARAASG